jgi:hypothetical protein
MKIGFIKDLIHIRVCISFQPDYVRQNVNCDYNEPQNKPQSVIFTHII